MPTAPIVVPRRAAVREIVAALADRTAFVVLPPRGRATDVADRLRRVEWAALLDNGYTAMRCTRVPVIALAESLATPGAVILVPKSVPADELGRALGSPIPDDGSRDLVLLDDGGDGRAWPSLFLDALEQVDAASAQSIRDAAAEYAAADVKLAVAAGVHFDNLDDDSAGRIAAETARRVLGDYAAHLTVHPPLTTEEDEVATGLVEQEGSGILNWIVEQVGEADRNGTMPAGRTPSENVAVRIVRQRFAAHLVERTPR